MRNSILTKTMRAIGFAAVVSISSILSFTSASAGIFHWTFTEIGGGVIGGGSFTTTLDNGGGVLTTLDAAGHRLDYSASLSNICMIFDIGISSVVEDASGIYHAVVLPSGGFVLQGDNLGANTLATVHMKGFLTDTHQVAPGGDKGDIFTFILAPYKIDPYLYSDGGGTYQGYFTVSVPEPSTWAMMILGFAGVGFMSYRRKAKLALMAV